MDKVVPALIMLGVVVLVFTGLALGWRARRRRQIALPAPGAPTPDLGAPILVDDGFYVATTFAGAPTDRVAVRGLAFRSRAIVSIVPEGLVLGLAGQPEVFIPRETVRGVGRATWTIDRVVGRDGLVFVRWALGDREVDTYLRSRDPDALATALQTLESKEAA